MGSGSQSLQWQGKPLLCTGCLRMLKCVQPFAKVRSWYRATRLAMTHGWSWIGSSSCGNVCFNGKVRHGHRFRQHISRLPGRIVSCITTSPWLKRLLKCITIIMNADWSTVDPMEYLTPFIEVIRSPEISGPITGVALTAVSRFLDAYIIGNCQQYTFSLRTLLLMSVQCNYGGAS